MPSILVPLNVWLAASQSDRDLWTSLGCQITADQKGTTND